MASDLNQQRKSTIAVVAAMTMEEQRKRMRRVRSMQRQYASWGGDQRKFPPEWATKTTADYIRWFESLNHLVRTVPGELNMQDLAPVRRRQTTF